MAYNPGDRIEFVHTDSPFSRLKPGDQGTVSEYVEEEGEVFLNVEWDNGSDEQVILSWGEEVRRV